MNYDTLVHDHATAVSRGERIRSLEILLHAILQRHHPNGCELTQSELARLDGPGQRPMLRTFRNSQRGSIIVASSQEPT